MAARAALVEGPDPARVPQHDLLRQRRLRHPAGGADVLRQGRRPPDAAPSPRCSPASPPTRRSTTRPSIHARRRSGATTCCRRCSTRGRSPRAQLRNASTRAAAEGPRTSASPAPRDPGQYFVNYVKDQLIATYGAGRVFGGGLKVTSTIDLGAAGDRPQGDRERPQDARRARPRRSSRSTRARAPSGRWSAARTSARASSTSPTQAERQPGSSFKPIVLAIGAAAGHLAGDDVRLQAGRHRRRRPDLARHELRGRLPRPRRPDAGDGCRPTTRSTRS